MLRDPHGRLRWRRAAALGALLLVAVTPGTVTPARSQEPAVVHAVLFFSPECGHCQYVINDVLPGVFEANGGTAMLYWDETLPEDQLTFYLASNGQLVMLFADITQPQGAALFESAGQALGIGSDGVPSLVVGDRNLIGSTDIPEQFPVIVGDALGAGTAIAWPDIPGLAAALVATGATITTGPTVPTAAPTVAPSELLPHPTGLSPWERFRLDPMGNALAVIVLVIMAAAIAGTLLRLRRATTPTRRRLEVPVLALIGIAIAAYLAYVEVGERTAVCGPVGDCNTVQQSEYARLFGVIPIGVLGIVGYTIILLSWVLAHRTGKHSAQLTIAGFAVAALGVLFSIYLTFLEPFVIGATCAWCLGSALTITTLMWVSGPEARAAWRRSRIRAF